MVQAMIRERSKERWMVQAMDQEEVVRTMDGASGGSESSDGTGSSRRSNRLYHRWIRKQSKEQQIVPPMDQEAIEGARWVVQAMDQEDVEGAMDGTTDGSESKEQQMQSPMDQEAL